MWCTIDNLGDAKAAARDLELLLAARSALLNWHFADAASEVKHAITELEEALAAWEDIHA